MRQELIYFHDRGIRVEKERTLVILKPDAVARGLTGTILSRFEMSFKIVALRMFYATETHLNEHFPSSDEWVYNMGARARVRVREELSKDPDEYFGAQTPMGVGRIIIEGCRNYYVSGPLVALILEGESVVAKVRELIGSTLPSKAKNGTIRGDFGIIENEEELRSGAARNLVHASDSPEEARREIFVWFSEEGLP